jgi:tetratricopeptide (TPR) repeat protein
MFDVLKQIGRGDAERIDEVLGREICKHAGADGLVLANIRRFGELYAIDLKLLDPVKNEHLFTARQQGKGKESIPAMIDRLSEELRSQLKERESEIRAARRPVAQSTTANLDAYRHFFQGEQLLNRSLDWIGAEREFRLALERDPDFALAHFWLARALSGRGAYQRKARSEFEAALRLTDRLPERDLCNTRAGLLRAEARIAESTALSKECATRFPEDKVANFDVADISFHNGDLETAMVFFEKGRKLDPLNLEAVDHLLRGWQMRERHDQMIAVGTEYVRLAHSDAAYRMLAWVYQVAGNRDGAEYTLREGERLFPTNSGFANIRIAWFLQGGEPEKAEEQLALSVWATNPPWRLHSARWRLHTIRGRYRTAVGMLDEDASVASKEGDSQRAGSDLYRKAEVLLGTGDVARSRQALASARAVDPERLTFLLYLAQGDLERAAADAAWHSTAYLAAARAAKEEKLESAISQYELVATLEPLEEAFALFELATLYLRGGEPRKAIRPLRLLQSRVPSDLTMLTLRLVPSYRLLGQAYERSGEPAAALEAYRRVLRMWSEADPDLPELIETRARVAELQQSTPGATPTSARP